MTSVYARDGDLWIPSPEARGPFEGQHGGGVGAVLAAAMEEAAEAANCGEGMQLCVYILRRVPMEPMQVAVRPQRVGGRLAVFAAEMSLDGEVYASATAAFIKPLPLSDVPPVEMQQRMPAGADYDKVKSFDTGLWFGSLFDMKKDAAGCVWMRANRPIVEPRGALSFAAGPADWASGITRPDWFGTNSVAGFPNVDLTLHLDRPPVGDWIGLEGSPAWHGNGVGQTSAILRDTSGTFGRVAQTIVLVEKGRR